MAHAERVAVASLPPREKQVLELAYFEGYSQSEIANRLHAPLGTVKTWMRSALTRLRLGLDAVQKSSLDCSRSRISDVEPIG